MFRSSGTLDRNIRDVVVSENTELKKFYEQMKRELRSILSRHVGILGRGVLEDASGLNKRGGGGRVRPTRVADVGFTGSLKKQWNSLKQLVEVLEARASQPSEVSHVISVTDHEKELTRLKEEVKELREELAQSKELIGHQQQLLQDQMLPSPGTGQQSPLWDAYFLEEQLRLQEDRAVFEEQRLAFQGEREKFTEAAIRLGRERLQFKADQALFMKQQFLNMTPGVATPPWKKTPPWSALSAGTPTKTTNNSKKQFTPRMSYGNKMGLTSADPMTPSTAELYRVLRLAPPNRSTMSHNNHSCSHQSVESEEGSSDGWSDSLSPRSASPELHLPHSVAPFKESMTPYLCHRPTPVSVPGSHVDPRTPSSAELFRVLRLTPTESAHSGRKSRGDTLWKSVVHHSHRRASLSKVNEAPCYHETVKYSESEPRCPYELTGDGYETDSLHSDDMGRTMDQGDTPTSDTHSLPRDESEFFNNDSLYRVTPLQETSHLHLGGHIPHFGDPDYYSQLAHFQSKGVWPCQELGEQRSSNGINSNGIQKGNTKESLQPKDGYRSRSRDTLHPQDACRSRSAESRHSSTECRSRSRERTRSRERCRTRSKEDIQRRHSLCHISRPVIHFEDECQNRVHHSSTKRRQSLESLQHKHGQSRAVPYITGTRNSRSVHRRSSQHHRDSLYTSGPGRSPLHLRQSCPSARNSDPWTCEQVVASNLCADLLTQFLDCSF
ncbi:uncharacterized protein LOC120933388 [Rana temporaria]|uniref:uncharacterized protein LOC120933388 n=1 Tax=Rana temporaria TaxID=8407 RepID=UPI001AADA74D|nr:uncharacterized protein LOC120933388 [Rana temporaria]